MADTQPMRSGPPHAHEVRDIRFWPIVWFSAALLLGVGVVVIGLDALLDYFQRTRIQPEREFSALQAKQLPPQPRLEVASGAELRQLRAREERLLSSYGWVDKDAGIARIPIERAMALLAQQGLPFREPPMNTNRESSIASDRPAATGREDPR